MAVQPATQCRASWALQPGVRLRGRELFVRAGDIQPQALQARFDADCRRQPHQMRLPQGETCGVESAMAVATGRQLYVRYLRRLRVGPVAGNATFGRCADSVIRQIRDGLSRHAERREHPRDQDEHDDHHQPQRVEPMDDQRRAGRRHPRKYSIIAARQTG
jgi:hypothetical protein